jgi:hypothetical protein
MGPRRTLRHAAFVVAAGFAIVACGASDGGSGASTPEAASDASSAPAPTDAAGGGDGVSDPVSPSTAPEILQFTGSLVGGGVLDAAELSGQPTAFWFWSPT